MKRDFMIEIEEGFIDILRAFAKVKKIKSKTEAFRQAMIYICNTVPDVAEIVKLMDAEKKLLQKEA